MKKEHKNSILKGIILGIVITLGVAFLQSCRKESDYICYCTEPILNTPNAFNITQYTIHDATLDEASNTCLSNSYCVIK